MSADLQPQHALPLAVSVADMARACGLSRSRFHQLVKEGVFPPPSRDEVSSRPYYDRAAQVQCLAVRRSNCGVNGRAVLFYSRRAAPAPRRLSAQRAATRGSGLAGVRDLVEGLAQLGIVDASENAVAEALRDCFPQGITGIEFGKLLRAVHTRLSRQDSGDTPVR